MVFDPFGDFQTKGYLRNVEKLSDKDEIKHLEHIHFKKNVSFALRQLEKASYITYQDVLKVHKTLFQDFYPWGY